MPHNTLPQIPLTSLQPLPGALLLWKLWDIMSCTETETKEATNELATQNQGDDKMPFRILRLAGRSDFFSCCRLCVTSYDQKKMNPIFADSVGLIFSKITRVISLEIHYEDGLPDSICNTCLQKLNSADDFIEKSLCADRLFRKALDQARAVNTMCTSEPLNVKMEDCPDPSSGSNPIASEQFECKPICSKAQSISNEVYEINLKKLISFGDNPADLNNEHTDFPDNPTALKGESTMSSGPQSQADLDDHNYCLVPSRPINPVDPQLLRIAKGQSIVVLKLAKPNNASKTKHGLVNCVNRATGETSRTPLECHVLSSHEFAKVQARLESNTQQTTRDTTSMLSLSSMNEQITHKPVAHKKIVYEQVTSKQMKSKFKNISPHRIVSCPICDKEFMRMARLRDHMYSHTGERPFACDTCGKAYARRHALTMHIRTHTETRETIARFVCEICGIRKVSICQLSIHMAGHLNQRPFTCPICKKGFNYKAAIRGHLTTHVVGKPFVCTICGRSYKQERSCLSHEAMHTQGPPPRRELKYQCAVCGKAFAWYSALKVHMTRHSTRVRNFECAHCLKLFFTRESVKRHIRVVHLAENLSSCTICGRSFKDPYYVAKHMQKKHGVARDLTDENKFQTNISL